MILALLRFGIAVVFELGECFQLAWFGPGLGGLDRSRTAGASDSGQAVNRSGTNKAFADRVSGQVDSVMNPQ